VGHNVVVKKHLKALLRSELTTISDMSHNDIAQHASVDDEGIVIGFFTYTILSPILHVILNPYVNHLHLIFELINLVRCTVGDWVEVRWDYTPGNCSEGGTGVVIALTEGLSTMTKI
jgi:hypothetical protein